MREYSHTYSVTRARWIQHTYVYARSHTHVYKYAYTDPFKHLVISAANSTLQQQRWSYVYTRGFSDRYGYIENVLPLYASSYEFAVYIRTRWANKAVPDHRGFGYRPDDVTMRKRKYGDGAGIGARRNDRERKFSCSTWVSPTIAFIPINKRMFVYRRSWFA